MYQYSFSYNIHDSFLLYFGIGLGRKSKHWFFLRAAKHDFLPILHPE